MYGAVVVFLSNQDIQSLNDLPNLSCHYHYHTHKYYHSHSRARYRASSSYSYDGTLAASGIAAAANRARKTSASELQSTENRNDSKSSALAGLPKELHAFKLPTTGEIYCVFDWVGR